MTFSWVGAVLSFQVSFAALSIAATVVLMTAYRFGWRSAALGTALAAVAIAILTAGPRAVSPFVVPRWIDGLAALLLLGFGGYFTYQFIDGIAARDSGGPPAPIGAGWDYPLNLAACGATAGTLVAESLDLIAVSLSTAQQEGATAVLLGIGMGGGILTGLTLAVNGTGIVRLVPPYLLDGAAASLAVSCGGYCLTQAVPV